MKKNFIFLLSIFYFNFSHSSQDSAIILPSSINIGWFDRFRYQAQTTNWDTSPQPRKPKQIDQKHLYYDNLASHAREIRITHNRICVSKQFLSFAKLPVTVTFIMPNEEIEKKTFNSGRTWFFFRKKYEKQLIRKMK